MRKNYDAHLFPMQRHPCLIILAYFPELKWQFVPRDFLVYAREEKKLLYILYNDYHKSQNVN